MSHNEDELIKELKNLKSNAKLDPQKKESMKMVLQQHAKKKRAKSKTKHSFIWFSTAAAILICGGLIYTLINTDQITLPADDNQQIEEVGNAGGDPKEPNDMEGLGMEESDDNDEQATPGEEDSGNEEVSQQEFKVDKLGNETQTIIPEGTEEKINVVNFRIEPYGIDYQVAELLNKYVIEENTVKHHGEDDMVGSIRLSVEENETIEQLSKEFQEKYSEEFDNVSEVTEPTDGDNPYSGLTQRVSATPQGYYLYQIEENVLVIQYEYDAGASDGMGPRLQKFIESIR
ncbi:hypothetical protein SAMN04487943_101565 [Gracilibacillus orientalis]|uniref:DUF4367 domain-containing protein n=1 Tax=Gracilibacillus orientalis TaxID=334253 RepID=A0A1I4HRX8_9BACI|nr:hypothetical protein [Gracilibacillus orientalis]SFL44086.1 hypothetical protein SAMN04487943_101565 [Gracilibacillus orientalis]